MNVTKLILLSVILFSQIGCSQKLTLERINAPSKKYFIKELEKQNEPYKDFPDMVEETTKNEKLYFNVRIEARNKALKDIDFKNKKTIIIIDKLRTNYSGLVEESFIFTDNKGVYSHIVQSAEDDTIRTVETNNFNENKLDDGVLKIYQNFSSSNTDSINKDFKDQFDKVAMPIFYVTVIKNGKVKYYTIKL